MTHASLYCTLTLILRPTGTVSTFLMVRLMIDRMLLLLGVPLMMPRRNTILAYFEFCCAVCLDKLAFTQQRSQACPSNAKRSSVSPGRPTSAALTI